MGDNLKPEDRRRTMQAVKGKGTRLERRLFSMLAGMGLKGWNKNASDIVGKPDVVFVSEQVAIFVDGCFWHGCPFCRRTLPKTNREYWARKIKRNSELAKTHNRRLRKEGWTVIRVWEHEVRQSANTEKIKAKILQALGNKGLTSGRRAD
jgi:DNA mismatch endonuclease (patch repair protein)